MDYPVGPVACKEDNPVKQPVVFPKIVQMSLAKRTVQKDKPYPFQMIRIIWMGQALQRRMALHHSFFANDADKPLNRQVSYKEDGVVYTRPSFGYD